MKKLQLVLLPLLLHVFICFSVSSQIITNSTSNKSISESHPKLDTIHNGQIVNVKKRTNFGLYVTSKEAFDMWEASPSQVKVLDVRLLEEYLFVGHAEMAYNAELLSMTHEYDQEKNMFSFVPNPNFISQVRNWANHDDVILVMCRSGGRSAMAVNVLHTDGFTKVYNIIDGMEGDQVKESESLYKGKRMKNGWKNSGLPWTYDVNVNQILTKNPQE